MPLKKKTSRRSESRIFKCTGFGDCNMVFTRSEHLARHARKHTGEKPFKCTFPACPRTFSRFDNMVQHTHTHDRGGKKNAPEQTKAFTTTAPHERCSAPPKSAAFISPNRSYSPPETFAHPGHHGLSNIKIVHPPHAYQSLTKSPPFDGKDAEDHISSVWNPYDMPWHGTDAHPSHYPMGHLPDAPDRSFFHPDFYGHSTQQTFQNCAYRQRSASPDSIVSDASSWSPPTPSDKQRKQRLSIFDLETPIEQLQEMPWHRDMLPLVPEQFSLDYVDERMINNEDGVDVTVDEYEALQGISKFCTEPVVLRKVADMVNDQPLLFSSQVPSLRQRFTLSQESFLRPSRQDVF